MSVLLQLTFQEGGDRQVIEEDEIDAKETGRQSASYNPQDFDNREAQSSNDDNQDSDEERNQSDERSEKRKRHKKKKKDSVEVISTQSTEGSIPFVDQLILGPIDKYEKHSKFPWKFLIHILMLFLTAIEVSVVVTSDIEFSTAL